MKALYKKELRTFLSSIMGTVVLGVFLLISGLFHWVFPGQWNLLSNGVAEMSAFFLFTPWVLMFLIPAITMRSIPEERAQGTLELLLTHPLDPGRIIMAKFLAGLTLVALALLPTLAGFAVLHALGNPPGNIDHGAVLAGYLGLLLLGGAFVATGLAASSRTESQVVAFLTGVVACLLMYYGPSALGSYDLFGTWDHIILWFALETHFRAIGTGIVVLGDLYWFVVYILIALTVARYQIQPGKS
jgi:ABC-2 type transport system permease protein